MVFTRVAPINCLLILILSCVITDGHTQSQADTVNRGLENILSTKIFSKGIYMSFHEFKEDKPSVTGDFQFKNRRLWLNDASSGKKKMIKGAWGFSDGKHVYVKWRKFNQLEFIDRYSYFREKGVRIVYGMSAFPVMIIPIPLPYEEEIVLNYNNGTIYRLTNKVVKKILSQDPELLRSYEKEGGKKKKFREYILRYNKRNVGQIKLTQNSDVLQGN